MSRRDQRPLATTQLSVPINIRYLANYDTTGITDINHAIWDHRRLRYRCSQCLPQVPAHVLGSYLKLPVSDE